MSLCSCCGGDAAECRDHDNQHAFVVTQQRCYRTRALHEAQRARKDDPDRASLIFNVELDPSLKKSAKVVTRG